MKPNQFYPSNGTAGISFIDTWCVNCIRDPASRKAEALTQCSILGRSLIGDHPKQWIYDENKRATCTSFRHYQEKKEVHKKRIIKNQLNLF
jgi:hypothetical protein